MRTKIVPNWFVVHIYCQDVLSYDTYWQHNLVHWEEAIRVAQ